MPIYTYKCDKCGETFDKMVKSGGSGCEPCAQCQANTSRVFSPVGIIFKGSGFYSTDYKSGKSSTNDSPDKIGSENKKGQKKQKIDTGAKDVKAEKTKSEK